MKTEPLKQQKEILEWSDGRKSVPILWTMGLGKSFASLYLLEQLQRRKTLLICPKSLFRNWVKEIKKHSNLSYDIAYGNKSRRKSILENTRADIVLLNPEGVRLLEKELCEITKSSEWDTLVVDELTRFRRKSKQTTALRKLSTNFNLRIGLSGLIITERLEDVFNPFLILDGGRAFGKDYFKFLNRYFEFDDLTHSWTPTDYGRRTVRTILKRFAHVRNEKDAEVELPPPKYVNYQVNMSQEQEALIQQIKDECLASIGGTEYELNYAIQRIQKIHQISSGFMYLPDGTTYWFNYNPKINIFNSIVEEYGSDKFLVWCVYKAEIVLVTKFLQDLGLKVCPRDKLDKLEDYDCAALSFAKDSQGLNLQPAKHNLIFSRPWKNDEYQQAKARTRRIGSRHDFISYSCLIANTVADSLVTKALTRKTDLVNYIKEIPPEEIWNENDQFRV
jgi:SNF2 family DNA or RNA helicase